MNFNELLIVFSLVIFAAVAILLWLARRTNPRVPIVQSRANWFFCVYVFLVAFFFLFSIYSGVVGQRPLIWFCFLPLVGMFSLYFGGSSKGTQRKFAITAVMLLAVIMSLMPVIQNRGLMFGPDQFRDSRIATSIAEQGTFFNASIEEGGFPGFYSIPLFSVFSAELSEILSCSTMTVIAFLPGILGLLSAISVYSVMMKLTNKVVVSLASVLLLLSIPRLSSIQAISSTVSICLGSLLILLYVKENASSLRSILPVTMIVIFTISVFHPVGIIPLALVCLGIIGKDRFSGRERLAPKESSFTKKMFAICLLISLAYWSTSSEVFVGLMDPLLKFVGIFTQFRTIPSIYTPQYYGSGFELFSFAWALPVAVAAAYLTLIPRTISTHARSPGRHRHAIAVAAAAGLLMIASAFLSIRLSPGASVERYVDVPGYFLLILPASLVFGYLLISPRKTLALAAVFLLSVGIFLGARSPDWAPFENPAFGATMATKTGYVEADTIAKFLPNATPVYEDHDIPVAEVASLQGKFLQTDISYQTTREVLARFKSNLNATSDSMYPNAVIVIKTDEIVDEQLYSNLLDITYNSGIHILVKP